LTEKQTFDFECNTIQQFSNRSHTSKALAENVLEENITKCTTTEDIKKETIFTDCKYNKCSIK